VHTAVATSGLAGISGAALFLALVVTVVLWFVPLIIAALYDLPRKGPIAVLSLALGWTGVAWLAALVIVVVGAVRAGEPPLVVPWPGPRGGGAGQQQPPRYPPAPQNPQYEDPEPPYSGPPPRGAHASPRF
jgi:hypothetical protein